MKVQVYSDRSQESSFVGTADIVHDLVNEDTFWGAYRREKDGRVILVDRLQGEHITEIVMSPDGNIIG